jgi:hypothetical protein
LAKNWITRHIEMFHGAEQVEHFRNMASIRPCRVVRRAENPLPLERGAALTLPHSYVFQDRTRLTEDFLSESETVGLMVLKDGKVVDESYRLGQTAAMQWPSWSVVKSMVSALIGIALEEALCPPSTATSCISCPSSRAALSTGSASRTCCRCRQARAGTKTTAIRTPTSPASARR